MTTTTTAPVPTPYGTLSAPATLTLQRRLPGPIERVWAYLTDGELRRQWLAAGTMVLQPGASFELVWRNDELSASGSERPEGFEKEGRATCELTAVEAPHLLCFRWPGVGEVRFELEAQGEEVLLTVTHQRLPDRPTTVMVGAGWHMHLDILVARIEGRSPASFWAGWQRLSAEYGLRLPV